MRKVLELGMMKQTRSDRKIDSFVGVSCYRDEKESWVEHLQRPDESLSSAARRVLNEAVKAETNLKTTQQTPRKE